MKTVLRYFLSVVLLLSATAGFKAQGQDLKINGPALLMGGPNIGYEHAISRQMSISGDILWLPYLFKKHEEVFRVFELGAEFRYYFKPGESDENLLSNGWYAGVYAMYGNFNIGLFRNNDMEKSYRDQGWGMSAGVSGGYKYVINKRWAIDGNLGLGFAHLQYDKYKLGGLYRHFPLERKKTRMWVGPTRFSISVVYTIPPDLFKWKKN